ncbi:MAG: Holliday junction resolvase RuvX [Dehalococcoidia bacterium]|nr:Holliday junction resolvase RuvX [Dehalococcoidia bacterium]
MRILALDVGDKRIGVARSDPEGMLASSLTVINRVGKKRDARAIALLAEENEAGQIVVGLPLNMDGSEGQQALKVKEFAVALSTRTRIPVEFWDERLSTFQAQQFMQQDERNIAERKAWIDAVSAAVILQSYLDSARRSRD